MRYLTLKEKNPALESQAMENLDFAFEQFQKYYHWRFKNNKLTDYQSEIYKNLELSLIKFLKYLRDPINELKFVRQKLKQYEAFLFPKNVYGSSYANFFRAVQVLAVYDSSYMNLDNISHAVSDAVLKTSYALKGAPTIKITYDALERYNEEFWDVFYFKINAANNIHKYFSIYQKAMENKTISDSTKAKQLLNEMIDYELNMFEPGLKNFPMDVDDLCRNGINENHKKIAFEFAEKKIYKTIFDDVKNKRITLCILEPK